MTYTKNVWEDGVTLIDAVKMNKLEKGVFDNDAAITKNKQDFDNRINNEVNTEIEKTKTSITTLTGNTNAKFDAVNNRLNVVEETKKGTYLTFDNTVPGIIQNLELYGNTVQNPSNLADIKSTGIDNGDGTFKYTVVACGENLFDGVLERGVIDKPTGLPVDSNDCIRSKNFMIVPPSGIISIWRSAYTGGLGIRCYDKNLKYYDLNLTVGNQYGTISFPPNIKYFKIIDLTNDLQSKIMIVEGSQYKTYTDPLFNYCEISLPCQLEEWDRLYFSKDKKAWCIKKATTTLNSNDLVDKFLAIQNLTDTTRFAIHGKYHELYKAKPYSQIICNVVPFMDGNDDVVHGRVDGTSPYGAINIWIHKSIPDINALNKYLVDSGVYIKFETLEPQKIVLPATEQVKLNSLSGKTNIYVISGEVDTEVSATVSKTLGATVQGHTNEISEIRGEIDNLVSMREAQDFAYETSKGYLVCQNTMPGAIKDLVLKGKTLVNVFPKLSTLGMGGGSQGQQSRPDVNGVFTTISANANYYVYDGDVSASPLLPNSPYTAKGFMEISCETAGSLSLFYVDTAKTNVIKTYKLNAGTTYLQFNEAFTTNELCNGKCGFYTNGTGTVSKIKYTFMMLKGDVRDITVSSYFEGIGSIGGSDGITVMTANENLFNESLMKDRLESDGYYHFRSAGNTRASLFLGIIDRNNTQLLSMAPNVGHDLTNLNLKGCKILIGMNGDVKDDKLIFPITDFAIGNFPIYKGCTVDIVDPNHIRVKDVYIKRGLDSGSYIPYKQDKRPVLFKDTDGSWKPITILRGLNEDNCDTIDTITGIYTQRWFEQVIDGTGSIFLGTTVGDTTGFVIELKQKTLDNSEEVICDKFKTTLGCYSQAIEGVYGAGNNIYVRIKSSKAATIEQLKSYLQDNNFTVVCKCKDFKQYETNLVNPSSFDDSTMTMIQSGPIAPYTSWKVTSTLPSFVMNISDRTRRLEDLSYGSAMASMAIGLSALNSKLILDGMTSK